MNKRDFKRFYDKNYDRIYRFVFFRIGGDRDQAEDLVAEIFLKSLEKFHTYDPEKSNSAWLYTIAKNHLANYFRSKYFRDVEPLDIEVWWQDQTWQMLDQEKDIKIFYKLLGELSNKEQKLVTLKYIEGYSYKEMSGMLGKSVQSLRVATHRAVGKLKKVAEKYELKEINQKSKSRQPAREKI